VFEHDFRAVRSGAGARLQSRVTWMLPAAATPSVSDSMRRVESSQVLLMMSESQQQHTHTDFAHNAEKAVSGLQPKSRNPHHFEV